MNYPYVIQTKSRLGRIQRREWFLEIPSSGAAKDLGISLGPKVPRWSVWIGEDCEMESRGGTREANRDGRADKPRADQTRHSANNGTRDWFFEVESSF